MRRFSSQGLLLLGIATFVAGCTEGEHRLQAPLHGDAALATAGVDELAARFILPQTGAINQLPPVALFRWDSYDTQSELGDLPESAAFFEYKLVEIESIVVDTDEEIIDALMTGENLLAGDGSVEWTRVSSSTRQLFVEQGPGIDLTFAVRAVAADGTVESDLERNRNFIPYVHGTIQPQPTVAVTEPRSGIHYFPNDGDVWEIVVAPGFAVNFDWYIDASHYGYYGGESNYALDVPDPDDETPFDPNGIGGWVGWERRTTLVTPFVFDSEDAGTDHVLYIKARDYTESEESVQLCEIRIHVAELTFEKWAAVIDDAKFATIPPSDEEHDAFIHDNVAHRLHDFGEVDDIAIYTPQGNNPERRRAREIPLDVLGQYKVLVWHTNAGVPVENATGLWLNRFNLATYLAGGGRLFIVGDRISSQLVSARGDFAYPKPEPTEFVRDYLQYRDEIVGAPTDDGEAANEAGGMVGATAVASGFPQLQLDLTKRDPYEIINGGDRYRSGIVSWEALMPDFYENEGLPGFEPLYTVDTFNTTICCGDRESGLETAYVAHRYESPIEEWENGFGQGRTVVFNFQPWWFEADQVREASGMAVDWLIEGLDPKEGAWTATEIAVRDLGR